MDTRPAARADWEAISIGTGMRMAGLVSPNYVRARWAYSELLSLGQGDEYQGPGIADLRQKLREKVPFDDLEHGERRLLVEQLAVVRASALQALDGINWFKQERLTKDQLDTVYVLPHFAHEIRGDGNALVTFRQWIKAEPLKPLNQWHARYASYGVPRDAAEWEPLTVGRYREHPQLILVDGYHRAVRFWSTDEPDARIAVYLPLTRGDENR
jgi:hypothetical protein